MGLNSQEMTADSLVAMQPPRAVPPFDRAEMAVHLLFALGLVGSVAYAYWVNPIAYLHLIVEDRFGDYASAVSYLMSVLFFLALAFRAGPFLRRIVWLGVSAGGFLIGMDKLGWGQRIFGLSSPSISNQSLQDEWLLHDIPPNTELHIIVGVFILFWVFASLLLRSGRYGNPGDPAGDGWSDGFWGRLGQGSERIGFPLIRAELSPIFLVAAFHFTFSPQVKSDEIGGFVLALGLLLISCDFWMEQRRGGLPPTDPGSTRRIPASAMLLLFVGVAALGLTKVHAGDLSLPLNTAAARDYPERGLNSQAEMLFVHILEHSEHRRIETRYEYAILLASLGRREKAIRQMRTGLEELFASKPESVGGGGAYWRQAGLYQLRLGRLDDAAESFARSIAADSRMLQQLEDPDQEARVLLSMVATEVAQGNIDRAVMLVEEADRLATTAKTRKQVRNWLDAH